MFIQVFCDTVTSRNNLCRSILIVRRTFLYILIYTIQLKKLGWANEKKFGQFKIELGHGCQKKNLSNLHCTEV